MGDDYHRLLLMLFYCLPHMLLLGNNREVLTAKTLQSQDQCKKLHQKTLQALWG